MDDCRKLPGGDNLLPKVVDDVLLLQPMLELDDHHPAAHGVCRIVLEGRRVVARIDALDAELHRPRLVVNLADGKRLPGGDGLPDVTAHVLAVLLVHDVGLAPDKVGEHEPLHLLDGKV